MHFFAHEEINLLEAAQDGKLEFIQQQLFSLISHSSKQFQEACEKTDYYGRNALHYAAYRGHYDVVEYFLDLRCMNLNSKDNKGNSALMLASVRGYNQDSDIYALSDGRKHQICKLLLQRGATLLEYQQDHINNPLHWACFFGDIQLTQLLLKYNPNLMLNCNDTKLFPIDVALIKLKGPQNNVEITEQEIEFLKKIEFQKKSIVEYLIVKFLAYYMKSEEHIALLKQLDADLEIQDSDIDYNIHNIQPVIRSQYEKVGLNYLFWASVLGREDLVKPLLDRQFSPFASSYKGRNAVHAASYNGHLNIVKRFFHEKSNAKKLVNIMTIERPQSALHIAVEQGYIELVRYLMEIGADHHLYNFRNHTAFAQSRSEEIKLLKQTILKEPEKNLIKSGYKYILVGANSQSNKPNLVEQQLKNIQEKTSTKGKFKSVRIDSFTEECVFYIIKVDKELKNWVAENNKMMIYNFKEGILCPFDKDKADLFENFHHYHDQQIILNLLYDEFNLDLFLHDKLLIDHFPMHEDEEKNLLYQQWKKEKWELIKEPLSFKQNRCRTPSALQTYFGAEAGFFFVFLIFFTSWLFLPAIPGILLGVYIYATNEINSLYVPIYTIALAVWATIFFEFWKRKQSETMFIFDMHIETEERKTIPSFKGQFWIEDVTHTIEIKYSLRDRWKYYKSVTPLVALAAIMIAGEQVGYNYVITLQEKSTTFTIICSIGLGVSIKVTNEIFNYFARYSLLFENHQYQDELENVYIMKVFTFAFLNSFGRLFYKSIISPDSDELNIMSIAFTILWAVIHLARFTLYPLIKYRITRYFLNRNYDLFSSGKWKKMYTSQMASVLDQESRQSNRNFDRKSNGCKRFIKSVEQNRIMMSTPNHVEQFTYFILQFCMVTMFSSSSQLIPVAIILFNLINVDAWLYGYISFVKRPIAEPKRSIGLWNDILLVVGYIGTVINCLTIYQANQDQLTNLIGRGNNIPKDDQALRNFLLLIAAEHIVIGLKFIIESVIPDEPEWVAKILKRQEYLQGQKTIQQQQEMKIKQLKQQQQQNQLLLTSKKNSIASSDKIKLA